MSGLPAPWMRSRLAAAGALVLGLIACVPPALSQPIGRLLLTPAQRLDLERLRSLRGGELPAGGAGPGASVAVTPSPAPRGPASAAVAAAPRPPAAPQPVQGWVLRSEGRSTVWMDGVPYYGFDAQGPVVEGAARRPADLLPEGALRIQRRP